MSNPLSALFGALKVFVPVFLFFMVVGAVAGFGHRSSTVHENLLAETTVRLQGEYYVFEYNCAASNAVFIYSVDENRGEYLADLSTLVALKETELALPTERLEEYRTVISALLGGVVGGVNLKSALKKPPGGWTWKVVKKTLLGIVGSVSGYSSGYYLGAHYDTGCDSDLAAAALKDKAAMIRVERAQLLVSLLQLENLKGAALSQTGNAIYEWDKDPAFMCSAVLRAEKETLMAMMQVEIEDPNSTHFQLIDRITATYNKVAGMADYQTLVDLNVFKLAGQFDDFEESDSVVGERVRNNRQKWNEACEAVGRVTF
jgi:hypothetical protein